MLATSRALLILAAVLMPGCFQAQAPRPAVPAAGAPGIVSLAVQDPAEFDRYQTIAGLALLARESENPLVRSEAIYAIADSGEDADAAIVGGALTDPDPGVRRAAVVALTGYDGEVPASLLAIALNDADPRVRLDAVEALAEIGGPTARLALRQALSDPDQRVRSAAIEMLQEPARP